MRSIEEIQSEINDLNSLYRKNIEGIEECRDSIKEYRTEKIGLLVAGSLGAVILGSGAFFLHVLGEKQDNGFLKFLAFICGLSVYGIIRGLTSHQKTYKSWMRTFHDGIKESQQAVLDINKRISALENELKIARKSSPPEINPDTVSPQPPESPKRPMKLEDAFKIFKYSDDPPSMLGLQRIWEIYRSEAKTEDEKAALDDAYKMIVAYMEAKGL